MKPDDFETELQRHSIRSIPDHWREEILKTAKARSAKISEGGWLKAFKIATANILVPNRQSWCAVAAAWVLILFLQSNASEPFHRSTAKTSAIQETAIHFGEQRKLLLEILNDPPAQAADRPKTKRPELRSQCNRELIFA